MLKHWQFKLTWLAVEIAFALAAPVRALEVKINPEAPQQGDTISVFIETQHDQQPTVSLDQKDYPVFPISGNQSKYRALLPTSPLDRGGKMVLQVRGDGETKNIGIWLKTRTFPLQYITLSGNASRPATKLELERVAQLKELKTPEKLWQGAFIRPNNGRISTVYGVRRYYNGEFATDYYHKGVDYAGGLGGTIVAPAGGRIELVGTEAEGFHVHGNTVGIDHGQGIVSIFMHLNTIDVKEGDVVKAGDKIGTIGSTGASTGPHLHWGLYVHGVAVDPVPWRFSEID